MGRISDAFKEGVEKSIDWIKEGPTPDSLAEKASEIMDDLEEKESEETDQDEDE